MRKRAFWISIACLCLASALPSFAQEHQGPPKILSIDREVVKPGKGAAHEKTEAAFVRTFEKAKWPEHYLAATEETGSHQVWFFFAWNSFADYENDAKMTAKNAAFSAELARDDAADGELLTKSDSILAVFSPETSYGGPVDIAHMRYFDIFIVHVRPGHDDEYREIAKLLIAAHEKAKTGEQWADFEVISGAPGGTHLIISPRKSLAEWDDFTANKEKPFEEAMGKEGFKKFEELAAASTDKTEALLLAFSPSMSYAPEDWVKADPEFWKPKSAAMPAAAPKKKPAKAKSAGK